MSLERGFYSITSSILAATGILNDVEGEAHVQLTLVKRFVALPTPQDRLHARSVHFKLDRSKSRDRDLWIGIGISIYDDQNSSCRLENPVAGNNKVVLDMTGYTTPA